MFEREGRGVNPKRVQRLMRVMAIEALVRGILAQHLTSSARLALNAASNVLRDFVMSRSIDCDRAGHFTL